MSSIKGDITLDPFSGSGTITKIAIENERNSVGYEADENFLIIMSKKINKNAKSHI